MTYIKGDNISIDFPIFGVRNRSLKQSVVKAVTGGRLLGKSDEFATVRAINNASFSFKSGDKVGLYGHNGSGKSTFLRALAGIYEPSEGVLTVEGAVVPLLDLFLGMDMEATGYENILIRGLLMGFSTGQMKERVNEIADFSGLGEYLYLPMRTYSSGMAMRLAFAISTSVGCDILLMDEWLSVGDQDFLEKSKMRLNECIDKAKIVIIASHDLGLLEKVTTSIYKLEHGSVSLM